MDLRRFFFRAGNTIPIATLLGPGLGRVDGTAAMYEEEGYIFLFNPSPRIHNASLVVDESLGADANRLFAPYLLVYTKPIILPRQALHKHGSVEKKGGRFLQV
jgi:hypothetical protein